jgi:hypothetical protein
MVCDILVLLPHLPRFLLNKQSTNKFVNFLQIFVNIATFRHIASEGFFKATKCRTLLRLVLGQFGEASGFNMICIGMKSRRVAPA